MQLHQQPNLLNLYLVHQQAIERVLVQYEELHWIHPRSPNKHEL